MGVTIKSKISLALIGAIFFLFGILKMITVFGLIAPCLTLQWIDIGLFVILLPTFFWVAKQYVSSLKSTFSNRTYSEHLNKTLIEISRNPMFFEGDIEKGTKIITKEISKSLMVKRCSIWLYNNNKTSIVCEQLYCNEADDWYSGIELYKKDYEPYFKALIKNPVIVANNAETDSITSCFTESYLKPNGIKSMLDVPIMYKGGVIGVLCIESTEIREWFDSEINFAQTVSSLYSFAYSLSENIIVSKDLKELEKFIDQAALVSKTDKDGKITYVNKKFEQISGWKGNEAIGKDHNIVSSGIHSGSFWKSMYRTTVKNRGVWNDIVTNTTKDGRVYHVDTYIKGIFDQETDEFKGFMSIRHDVTDVFNALNEIDKKNTYLEHAAKILRHDMHSGIHIYIPRGISSLERRLTPELIKQYKLESPLKMLKEGLEHTQRIYKGVFEFTNLVKMNSILEKKPCKLDKVLDNYLQSTSYRGQVILSEYLPVIDINESLFCTAIDNLIRNGLKYNDSETKVVAIFLEDNDTIAIQDNGRGMSQEDFDKLSKPYARKEGQKESGTGLGLNICIAILNEHGFEVNCEKLPEGGTKIKIKFR